MGDTLCVLILLLYLTVYIKVLLFTGSSPQQFYSLEVMAKDGGYPQQVDVTTVQISVSRNNGRPIWRVDGTGTITILETQPLSESIGRVCPRLCDIDLTIKYITNHNPRLT